MIIHPIRFDPLVFNLGSLFRSNISISQANLVILKVILLFVDAYVAVVGVHYVALLAVGEIMRLDAIGESQHPLRGHLRPLVIVVV